MKKIYYFPKPNNSNQYSNNTIKAIENAGDFSVVNAPTLKEFIKNPLQILRCNRADFLIVNWLESHLARKDGSFSLIGTFKFFSYLLLFKIIAKKLIYVRHNTYPHNMSGKSAKLATKLTDICQKFCNAKVAHSGHLSGSGYTYIPHPLYGELNTYSEKRNGYYIIFGKIERYKNIESVILNWISDFPLLIAGSVGDEVYLKYLKGISQGRNVKFDARFIPDSEAEMLVSQAKALIIAHADDDMIVSGSFFYALSLGVPVISKSSKFFEWLVNARGFKSIVIFDCASELENTLKRETFLSAAEVLKEADENFGALKVELSWKSLLSPSNTLLH